MTDSNELQEIRAENGMISASEVGTMVQQIVQPMIQPILESMATFMQHSTEALERIAVQNAMQTERLEALEKQIRMSVTMTNEQAKYLREAMKARAMELLAKWENDEEGFYPQRDRKAVTKLTGLIRKALLMRYGIRTITEAPRHEYEVALTFISLWDERLTVRDLAREVRHGAE